jgi:hypothetical protein
MSMPDTHGLGLLTLVTLLGCLVGAETAVADAPTELAEVLANETKAAAQQIHLTWTRSGGVDDYTIQVVLPSRVHVVRQAAAHTFEFIAVPHTIYYRVDGSAWQHGPYRKPSALPIPSLTDFVRGLSDLTEVPGVNAKGEQVRSFKATTSWHNGTQVGSGTIELTATGPTFAPTRLDFNGKCGSQPCSFVQTFSYDKSIKVEAPP